MAVLHRVLDPNSPQEMPSNRCALSIMTKAPRAGRVKTRLTPPLTPEESAGLNICFLRDTAAGISVAVAKGLAQGVGVYTPLGEESAYDGILPGDFFLVPQRGDPFGERLINAAGDLLKLGFASVCLIDSDSPTVPESAYSEAAEMLAKPGDRIVLGPSDDGGYYLIGMKQPHRRLFEEIDWSTERVLSQTKERAAELGVELHLLPTHYDVDDRATLRRLCDELLTEDTTAAPQTRGYLQQIIAREGRARIWPNE